MSEREGIASKAKFLSQKDLEKIKAERKILKPSGYRALLDKFMNSSSPGLVLEHLTTGEQAGVLGLAYQPPYKGKLEDIISRQEDEIEKDKVTGKPVMTKPRTQGKKPVPRHLYTIILQKKG